MAPNYQKTFLTSRLARAHAHIYDSASLASFDHHFDCLTTTTTTTTYDVWLRSHNRVIRQHSLLCCSNAKVHVKFVSLSLSLLLLLPLFLSLIFVLVFIFVFILIRIPTLILIPTLSLYFCCSTNSQISLFHRVSHSHAERCGATNGCCSCLERA